MLYAIISQDVKDSLQKRKIARREHVARLNQLKDEGRLILAGPHPAVDNQEPGDAGFTGSLVVAEFEDLKAAQSWAYSDPYVKAGVYSSFVVKTFNKVLP
jgi:uncharacterized protein YciI